MKRFIKAAAGVLAVIVAIGIFFSFQFNPNPDADRSFRERAQQQSKHGLTVRASALSPRESRRSFGENLAAYDIQPVWISIDNNTDDQLFFLPIAIDPAFYSPYEVSYRFNGIISLQQNKNRERFFADRQISNLLPPKSHTEGFVYANMDSGVKFTNVFIVRKEIVEKFEFSLIIPGPPFLGEDISISKLYPGRQIKSLDLNTLKSRLSELPCCTTNAEITRQGDPLNLVVIEDFKAPLRPFFARGWNVTEKLNVASIYETARAFIFRDEYLTSPVSPLFLFGRREDGALQKARSTINERVHLRLWLTPETFESRRIWVGQISRDIGVRITTQAWNLTTHKIAPDVDFDRDYLLQDLLISGAVDQFGYVDGVIPAPISEPRTNLTGDEYFTDGRRLVIFLSPRSENSADIASPKQIWVDR
jgi:hypothetical protein